MKKKEAVIKEYLNNNYNLEIDNLKTIDYKIFPQPNLYIRNINLKIKDKPIVLKSNSINIFLNFKNIYNYKNFKVNKILLNESELILDFDRIKELAYYLNKLQHKLNINNLDLVLLKDNNPLVEIKNIIFLNYGYRKNYINGYIFGKKFKTSLDKENNLKLKILDTGVKASLQFEEKKIKNSYTGSSKISLPNNILKFKFDLNNSQLKILDSNLRNNKLSLSLDSIISFNPFFSINSNINIKEINKKFLNKINLENIHKHKDLLKKLNSKISINYNNKNFFTGLLKNYSSDIKLAYGRLVFSNTILITSGRINCEGDSMLVDEYPRLNFNCILSFKDKNKLIKKFSISKKIKKEPLDLNIEGTLNLFNKKIIFKNITTKNNYKANTEDLKYFKKTFENILFDESFFKIFNKDKIKEFILEVI